MKYCLDCGYEGHPEQPRPGTTRMEVVLWLCFLVPGLIYSLWRLLARSQSCGRCGSKHIIPADSQIARTAHRSLSPTPSAQSWFCDGCGKPIFSGGRFCSSCGAFASGASGRPALKY